MNLKREEQKKKVFYILYCLFAILTFFGAILCINHTVDNPGYAVIPMLIALIFNVLYRNSKKAIEENEQ